MEEHQERRSLAIKALIEKPPASLFAEPVEYIFAEHFRQRSLCSVLEQIAEQDPVDIEMAEAAQGFLETDFPLHVIDEEEDLFPLLRRRAKPDDGIKDVLGQLSHDHALDQFDAETLLEVLSRFVSDRTGCCSKAEAQRFKAFATNEKRHLICENAIVLPLARIRLTPADMHSFGRRMAARRGIDFQDPKDAH